MNSNENSKTKQCKYCKSEISANAKICPNCKKKQSGKMKWIIIVAIVIIFIAAIAGTSNDNEPKKVDSNGNTQTSTDNNSQTSFKVGETVELNDIRATLVSVTESSGSQFAKPADGNTFLLCEFNIENNSNSEITVSSIMSFEAYCDDYSINQSVSGLLNTDKTQLDGTVASGKKMNGVIAYEVPSNWKNLEVSFTPDFWGKAIKFIATK